MRITKIKEELVTLTEIHGSYPYKLYLEITGSNTFGRYIVVVSNKQIVNKDTKEVKVQFENARNNQVQQTTNRAIQKIKNMEYKARVLNPVDVRKNNIKLVAYELKDK
jgi:hypothetical protein